MPGKSHEEVSDAELMARLARGEKHALDSLFLRHGQRVFALAYRYLSSRAEAEDVTQETFLRILSAAKGYRDEGAFKTWLLTITSRLCQKRHSLHARWREQLVGLFHPSMDNGAQRDESPADELIEKESVETVRQAVQALPADQRMAVLLARFEGLSYDEISSVMGKSNQAVTSLLWRGRRNLREMLRANFEEKGKERDLDAARNPEPTGSR